MAESAVIGTPAALPDDATLGAARIVLRGLNVDGWWVRIGRKDAGEDGIVVLVEPGSGVDGQALTDQISNQMAERIEESPAVAAVAAEMRPELLDLGVWLSVARTRQQQTAELAQMLKGWRRAEAVGSLDDADTSHLENFVTRFLGSPLFLPHTDGARQTGPGGIAAEIVGVPTQDGSEVLGLLAFTSLLGMESFCEEEGFAYEIAEGRQVLQMTLRQRGTSPTGERVDEVEVNLVVDAGLPGQWMLPLDVLRQMAGLVMGEGPAPRRWEVAHQGGETGISMPVKPPEYLPPTRILEELRALLRAEDLESWLVSLDGPELGGLQVLYEVEAVTTTEVARAERLCETALDQLGGMLAVLPVERSRAEGVEAEGWYRLTAARDSGASFREMTAGLLAQLPEGSADSLSALLEHLTPGQMSGMLGAFLDVPIYLPHMDGRRSKHSGEERLTVVRVHDQAVIPGFTSFEAMSGFLSGGLRPYDILSGRRVLELCQRDLARLDPATMLVLDAGLGDQGVAVPIVAVAASLEAPLQSAAIGRGRAPRDRKHKGRGKHRPERKSPGLS